MRFTIDRVGTRFAGVSLIALATITANPVYAQQSDESAGSVSTQVSTADDASQSQEGLNVIVVTARRVAENLQDVPVAVTAFTGDDLIAQNIQRVQDIGNFTPGLSIRQGPSTSTSLIIALRGQQQSDVIATVDPSVGVYVDDVYWARAYGLNGNFLDVESVQVLKGPQGTLFGRNTTGGALLINSNNPKLDEFSGRLSAAYGRFNERELTGVINVPIGDKIALRVAGTWLKRDGYTTNVATQGTAITAFDAPLLARPTFSGSPAGLKYDNRDRWVGRAKALFQITDNLSLTASAEVFRTDERPGRILIDVVQPFTASNSTYSTGSTGALFVGVTNGGPPPTSGANAGASIALGYSLLNQELAFVQNNPRLVSNNEVNYNFAETQTYNATVNLDTFFGAVKFIGSYRKIEANSGFDLDGSRYALLFTESQQNLKQYSGELQITGKAFNDRVDFAAGVFAFHEDGVDQSLAIVIPALNPNSQHAWGFVDTDSVGAYTQATVRIADNLSFTAGGRYSVDDRGLETRTNNFNRTTGLTTCAVRPGVPALNIGVVQNPVECSVERRDSFGDWSYTAGFEFKPTEDTLLYIKTAKGVRAGGQNLRVTTNAAFVPFNPEIAYSYEIGAKGEFFDRRLRVNLAAYTTDVKDIQRTALVATPGVGIGIATVLGNAGKARFQGMEAEVAFLVTDGLTLSASGALVYPKYVEFSDVSGDRSFERFPGVAEEQFAVAADYDRDLSSSIRLRLRADYAWRSELPLDPYFFAANPNNDQLVRNTTGPALGLLGARATLEFDGRYEIGIFGRNLTNEMPPVGMTQVIGLSFGGGIRQEPATYGITASVNF